MAKNVAKLDIMAVALSFAAVAAIFRVICALLWWSIPGPFMGYTRGMMHGMDITPLLRTPTLGSTIVGVIYLAITAFVVGALFAWLYNMFVDKLK